MIKFFINIISYFAGHQEKQIIFIVVLLTLCISVEEEWVLKLELQVFVYGFYQVIEAKAIQDHEAVYGTGRPESRVTEHMHFIIGKNI